jgi:hypothetical protein
MLPLGTHDHIIVLGRAFTRFEMGPSFLREEGSDCYWPLPFCVGVTLFVLSFICRHLLAVCLSNVGALTSRNPMGLHGL